MSGDLKFHELNSDGYDHIIIGQEKFDIPKGKTAYARRLCDRFPQETAGINALLDTVAAISREVDGLIDRPGILGLLSMPWRSPALTRWGLRTAESFINHFTRDPLLRAILASQCGDHGLPPSLAPVPVHAAVMNHYFNGGYYPEGGGGALPKAFIRALKRNGGQIYVRAPVARILIEGREAIGVELADGTQVRAKHVISNADPEITFNKLVGAENLSRGLIRRLKKTVYSVSSMSLFAALDMDMKAAGFDSGNYWYYANEDIDGIYRQGMTKQSLERHDIPGFFLTVTTLKDPSKNYNGRHTIESFAFVPYEESHRWAGSAHGARPDEYRAFKEIWKKRLLKAVSLIAPGAEQHAVFADIGTPLTNEHFCGATKGNLYGTQKNRFQVGPWSYSTRTEIKNLFLCGASTLSHGVLGATLSGLQTAATILEVKIEELLNANGPPLVIEPSNPAGAAGDGQTVKTPAPAH